MRTCIVYPCIIQCLCVYHMCIYIYWKYIYTYIHSINIFIDTYCISIHCMYVCTSEIGYDEYNVYICSHMCVYIYIYIYMYMYINLHIHMQSTARERETKKDRTFWYFPVQMFLFVTDSRLTNQVWQYRRHEGFKQYHHK